MQRLSDKEALCDCVGRYSQWRGDPLHGYILENEESQNRPVRHIRGQTLQAVEEQSTEGTVPERNNQSIPNAMVFNHPKFQSILEVYIDLIALLFALRCKVLRYINWYLHVWPLNAQASIIQVFCSIFLKTHQTKDKISLFWGIHFLQSC